MHTRTSRATAFAEKEAALIATTVCEEHQMLLEGLPGKLRASVGGLKPSTATSGCSKECVHVCVYVD